MFTLKETILKLFTKLTRYVVFEATESVLSNELNRKNTLFFEEVTSAKPRAFRNVDRLIQSISNISYLNYEELSEITRHLLGVQNLHHHDFPGDKYIRVQRSCMHSTLAVRLKSWST